MTTRLNSALAKAVRRILHPLVRVLLRHGVGFDAFADLAKRVYVEVARADFQIPGKKQTTSRISVLTGLTRKEVQRLSDNGASVDGEIEGRYNRAARVIAGWVRDANFCDAQGNPLPLPQEGSKPSFAALVREYSGDMPARAVLDELLRVGAVERDGEGIRLVTHVYVPHASPVDKLGILGTDVADLIATIDHNLTHSGADARFQRKVMYDNVPVELLDEIRARCARDGQRTIESLDKFLAPHDRDINPKVAGSGRARVGMGIYFFEDVSQ